MLSCYINIIYNFLLKTKYFINSQRGKKLIKIILLCLLFAFARDPFLDFRNLKSLKCSIKKEKIIYLGLVDKEPILRVNSILIFPLENSSFKIYQFNSTFIFFKYKKKLYRISR